MGMPDPRGPFLDGKAVSKTLPLAESAALDKGSVPVNQPLLFQRLRWRLLHHSLEVTLQRSVVRLVLALVEFLRKLMERQAIRRMEAGTLEPQQIEDMGLALMRLEETVTDLAARFGLRPEELNLDLGPLGKLM